MYALMISFKNTNFIFDVLAGSRPPVVDKFADNRPAHGLPEQDQWEGLTLPMLKHELQKRGLPVKGTKRVLVARIREAPAEEQNKASGIKPGIAGIEEVATKEVSCSGRSAPAHLFCRQLNTYNIEGVQN